MKRLFRHLGKRGQSGQALVVLAIGFIGLLGFVGIVTDVSLLFIRYSTMRRAVDAASVAAAGQMRRVVDSNPTDTIAQDEADSVANLNLAARQFIELYGLEPTNVLVETCRAQQVNRQAPPGYPGVPAPADWPWTPLDRNNVALFVAGGAPNPAANADDVSRYQELCTEDELKLVRVTAQIEAPTIFMRLLGYDTITLTESAISQTAVIDVVLVFDVSESMLNETTYDDWDTLVPPQGVRYMPPYVGFQDFGGDIPAPYDPVTTIPRSNPWDVVLNCMQGFLPAATCGPYVRPDTGVAPVGGLNYMIRSSDPADYYHLGDNLESFEPLVGGGYGPCNPIDPAFGNPLDPDSTLATANGRGPCSNGTGRVEPREFCQVRGYTYSIHGLGASRVAPELQVEYAAYYGSNLFYQFGNTDAEPTKYSTTQFGGFVPMYNYFGCCNDPNGDGDFGDLICQPFREARDAASGFLARLDFLRGDRVAFVTFDRYATVIDPDGAKGVQSAMIETEYNLNDPANPTGPPLRRGAQEVLSSLIGVKAEDSTYIDINDTPTVPGDEGISDGTWNRVWDDGRQRTQDDFLYDEVIGNIHENPVYRACPYDKAATSSIYTNARTLSDGSPRDIYSDPLLHSVNTVPSWYVNTIGTGFEGFVSYEFRASCRGTNIGGALAAGSSTLYNTGRREGAVWIMVMLSDGAAGASNIVTRDGNPAVAPLPYNLTTVGFYNNPLNALGGSGRLDYSPLPAVTYGAFGLCPYGVNGSPGEVLRDTDPPYCLDRDPGSRHYCGTVAQNPGAFALDIYPNCVEFYDVDDYARDWADWIGVADLPGATSGAGAGRVTDQLLPTIFTIGFGLNFDNGTCAATDYDCQRGVNPPRQSYNEDYLGEELLRYIADVGDNFQIDNDYWQQNMGSRIANSGTPGARGACEVETPVDPGNPGGTYQPLPPMTSCGNYFVAATGSQLEAVFNEIASRMFTRLSQ